MCLVVTRDSVEPAWEDESLHKAVSGVSLRKVDWFTTNDVFVDEVEVPEVRWRTNDEPLDQGMVKHKNVAPINAISVNVVGPDLS